MITLALGVGANTAVFTVVNGVLFRALPYSESSRLVVLQYSGAGNTVSPLSGGTVRAIEARAAAYFASVGAARETWLDLVADGGPERFQVEEADQEYLRTLGPRYVLGSGFSLDDFAAGAERSVVLSYPVWKRRFGLDSTLVGSRIVLSDTSYAVRGVTSAEFESPFSEAKIWVALPADVTREAQQGPGELNVVARLRPGVAVASVEAGLALLKDDLTSDRSRLLDLSLSARSVRDVVVGKARSGLRLIWGAVAFVMLLAVTNLAGLMRVRQERRSRDLAVSAALGATPFQLAGQLLAEALVLALLGGLLGLAIGGVGVRLATKVAPANLTHPLQQALVNGRVVGFVLVVSVAGAAIAALLPLRESWRPDLSEVIKGGGSLHATRSKSRIVAALVAGEITLAFVLLVGAGLFGRGFLRLQNVALGFDPQGRITANVQLYPRYRHVVEFRDFYRRLLYSLRHARGISGAALVGHLPVGGSSEMRPMQVEGRALPSAPLSTFVGYSSASAGYFRTMGIPVLRGREFTDDDTEMSASVVIVSDALAQREWPGEDPIGKRVRMTLASTAPWSTVVGVVGSVRSLRSEMPAMREVYVPWAQSPAGAVDVVLRSQGNVAAIGPLVRSSVWAIDSEVPLGPVQTLTSVFSQSVSGPRFYALIVGTFALLALVLAVVGVYGVVAFAMRQREREFAIRIVLGADRPGVLRLVVGEALKPVAFGVLLGLGGALALGRVIRATLVGIDSSDPITLVLAAVVLATAAVLPCSLLGWRAAGSDPVMALRNEDVAGRTHT